MFRSVTLTDFQSHQSTHLPLGPFTVIVGSSSSGKSAIVRALRLVAENARGTTYVRQGAKVARVALEIAGSEPVLDASTVVTVERGKGVSSYTLRVAGMHDEPLVFTKCGSSVPDAVADALELGDAKLWLAGQFDRPFLLDETGAEVARVLGKLTNVNMIYTAVRESNRRASEARRFHTLKSNELQEAQQELQQYVSLSARLAAGRAAEEALDRAESLSARREGLARRIVEVEDAVTRADRARRAVRPVPDVGRLTLLSTGHARLTERLAEAATLQSRRSVQFRHVPDMKKFDGLLAQRAMLRTSLAAVVDAEKVRSRLANQVREARNDSKVAREQFAEALRSAGSCPLCGASAAHAQVDHVL